MGDAISLYFLELIYFQRYVGMDRIEECLHAFERYAEKISQLMNSVFSDLLKMNNERHEATIQSIMYSAEFVEKSIKNDLLQVKEKFSNNELIRLNNNQNTIANNNTLA